jgi:hypothetical protein
MNVEKAEKILIKRGIPRRFANRYAILLMKRGGQIKALDVWNIREDIKTETWVRRQWPDMARIFDKMWEYETREKKR